MPVLFYSNLDPTSYNVIYAKIKKKKMRPLGIEQLLSSVVPICELLIEF
jgi:hypothetical protein